MASSEEIEAALEVAIRDYEQAQKDHGCDPACEACGRCNDLAYTIAAHLSRLREEARFRDAAMEYCRVWSNVHDPLGTRIAVSDKLLAAFRALEGR